GCKLVLLDRSASLLDLTSEVCPGALPIVADVTSTQDMSAAARQAHQAYPKIDYLVAAAGIIGPVKSAIELSESEWDTLFNINVKGCWLACKEFMPSMIENRAGAVVLFSSSAAVRGSRYLPAYAASKGAVTTLTKSLAMSYADHNIRVNCVCPGTIESRMATQSF